MFDYWFSAIVESIEFFFLSKRNDYLLLMVLNITTVGRLSTCYNTEHTQHWSGSHESVFISKSWQLCPHTKLHMNVYSRFLKEILGIYSFRCYFLLECPEFIKMTPTLCGVNFLKFLALTMRFPSTTPLEKPWAISICHYNQGQRGWDCIIFHCSLLRSCFLTTYFNSGWISIISITTKRAH